MSSECTCLTICSSFMSVAEVSFVPLTVIYTDLILEELIGVVGLIGSSRRF